MGYPVVKITNNTSYEAYGTVTYPSIFCSNDDYTVEANSTWSASSRGVCLVSLITGVLRGPDGPISVAPFNPGVGTSQSEFAIGGSGDGYSIYPTGDLDDLFDPKTYLEPTEQQK